MLLGMRQNTIEAKTASEICVETGNDKTEHGEPMLAIYVMTSASSQAAGERIKGIAIAMARNSTLALLLG